MQMEYGLSRVPALIYNKAVSVFTAIVLCDFGNFYEHILYEFGLLVIHLGQRFKMVLSDC